MRRKKRLSCAQQRNRYQVGYNIAHNGMLLYLRAMMEKEQFVHTMNAWGKSGSPFWFMVDFELRQFMLLPLKDVDEQNLKFSINGFANHAMPVSTGLGSPVIEATPPPLEAYRHKFEQVMGHIKKGNSFLTNLTVQVPIKVNQTLEEIYFLSTAPYKVWLKNHFVLFSPESFVKISQGRISTFPMKGTLPDAGSHAIGELLENRKELAEHVTVVDLLRNDLSLLALDVEVSRFRYLDKINRQGVPLLQVSSEITGMLGPGYEARLGDILISLLPAGSISGAPKCKTRKIIRETEGSPRGWYTGVFGYFDGHQLDSGVAIRYIEQTDTGTYYRSGGGITARSNWRSEYQEILDKIYVPIA